MSAHICAVCLQAPATTTIMWPPNVSNSVIACCERCRRIREDASLHGTCIRLIPPSVHLVA